jgi:hypothetical protein
MTRRSMNLRWKTSNAFPQLVPKNPDFPVCPICNRHVDLETAKVDENGYAVHEECYLLKLHLPENKSA